MEHMNNANGTIYKGYTNELKEVEVACLIFMRAIIQRELTYYHRQMIIHLHLACLKPYIRVVYR